MEKESGTNKQELYFSEEGIICIYNRLQFRIFVALEKHKQLNLVRVSSIHSEKGRTHLSTLVLDTYWYERNIKSLIPWLSNTSKKKLGVRDLTRLKCHYVALSRARGLICIAALKKSVLEKDKQLLSEAGWNIIEI